MDWRKIMSIEFIKSKITGGSVVINDCGKYRLVTRDGLGRIILVSLKTGYHCE